MKISLYKNGFIIAVLLLVLVVQAYQFFDINALKERVDNVQQGNFNLAWSLSQNDRSKICINSAFATYFGTLMERCNVYYRSAILQAANGNVKGARSSLESAGSCEEKAGKKLEQDKAECYKMLGKH